MSETSLVERKVNKSRMAGLVHGGADVVAVDLACRLDDLSPNILVVAAAGQAQYRSEPDGWICAVVGEPIKIQVARRDGK